MSGKLVTPEIEYYFNTFANRFLERDILLTLFTYTEIREVTETTTLSKTTPITVAAATPGDIFKQGEVIGYIDKNGVTLRYLATRDKTNPICYQNDHFTLKAGSIANISKDTTTIAGIFLLNLHVLANPLGNAIPYINEVWKPDAIEQLVSTAVQHGKITVQQVYRFIDGAYYIGHFTEMFVPGVTEKGITTDKNVRKIRDEFIKEHATEMANPIISSELEKKLIQMDKDYLNDDPSKIFFDGLGNKAWATQRKKLFLTGGVIDAFEEGTGNYEFVDSSLSEGWKVKNLPTLYNEILKGSYERGVATADGGALTKWIVRVFEDLTINMDDCGSMHGELVDFNKINIKLYLGRTMIDRGKRILLTNDNMATYDKKIVEVLSPKTCKNKGGLCYVCCGETFRNLQVKVASVLASELSGAMLSFSMANMHGTIVEVLDFDYEKFFV